MNILNALEPKSGKIKRLLVLDEFWWLKASLNFCQLLSYQCVYIFDDYGLHKNSEKWANYCCVCVWRDFTCYWQVISIQCVSWCHRSLIKKFIYGYAVYGYAVLSFTVNIATGIFVEYIKHNFLSNTYYILRSNLMRHIVNI